MRILTHRNTYATLFAHLLGLLLLAQAGCIRDYNDFAGAVDTRKDQLADAGRSDKRGGDGTVEVFHPDAVLKDQGVPDKVAPQDTNTGEIKDAGADASDLPEAIAPEVHEIVDVVANDGPWCGDEECNSDETCDNCPEDCGICPECGDSSCDLAENCDTCPGDCGQCCGNGSCESEYLETCENCQTDCGCGDGEVCTAEETCCEINCGGKECGGDGCDGTCGSCQAPTVCTNGICIGCGDGQCGAGEHKCNCPEDCTGGCSGCCAGTECKTENTLTFCGSGGETCDECTGGEQCVGGNCLCVVEDHQACSGGKLYWYDSCNVQGSQVSCDDANACTTDGCSGSQCTHSNVQNNTSCGGGKSCQTGVCQYHCGDGVCASTPPGTETCYLCPADCGNCCGNGLCELDYEEDCSTCLLDCPCKCGECSDGECKGKAEICNGEDDDCNGSTDEGFGSATCGKGVCNHEVNNCVGGVPQVCDPLEGAVAEKCDGLDNDCDGATDEGEVGTYCPALGVSCPCDFACQPSGDYPETCTNEMEDEVYVPAGELWMGCNGGGNVCGSFSNPAHRVVLTQPYVIDRTEVTSAEYRLCVEAGVCPLPSTLGGEYGTYDPPDKQDHPINYVSFNAATAYCEFVGKRLCTEAEWEKAARGGCATLPDPSLCETGMRLYPWEGTSIDCTRANYDPVGGSDGCGKDSSWAVGSFPAGASPYGALDMSGNVAEYVADWFAGDYYCKGADAVCFSSVFSNCEEECLGAQPWVDEWVDPPGPPAGYTHTNRSGGWQMAYWAHTGNHRTGSGGYMYMQGFRCCKSPDE
jgi:formylglycine-generating enzyme required for sulfatase activity